MRATQLTYPASTAIQADLKQVRIDNPILGSRPSDCELPGRADAEAMGRCSYEHKGMSRCGCSGLDPKKNREAFMAYVAGAKELLVEAIAFKTSSITLTFFASGYLLLDYMVLIPLLKLAHMHRYKGTINLQFVDTKYAAKEVPVENRDELMLGAVATGLAATGSGVFAAKSENKRDRNLGLLGTLLFGFGSIALGIAAAQTETEYNDKKAEKAIKSFKREIKELTSYSKFEVTSLFFASVEECIGRGKESDMILGYDIEASRAAIDSLRKKVSHPNSGTITMAKIEGDVPLLSIAHGSNGDWKREKLITKKTKADQAAAAA